MIISSVVYRHAIRAVEFILVAEFNSFRNAEFDILYSVVKIHKGRTVFKIFYCCFY